MVVITALVPGAVERFAGAHPSHYRGSPSHKAAAGHAFRSSPGARAVITTALTFNVYDNITQAAGVGTQDANCETPERTSPNSGCDHVSFGQLDGL